jgi:branched-chain amino acid transport system ATP-binding protein
MSALLEVENVSAGYSGHPVVEGVNLEVEAGQVVALLGANGAGKTTSLMTIAGEVPLLAGQVQISGVPVESKLHQRAREGLALVTEDRSVFFQMTVLGNLRAGRCDIAEAVRIFPELKRLMSRQAGLLSGGEQQMLSVGRALARRPKILIVDELSLGLAPMVVVRLLDAVREAADSGVGVLLVEQHLEQALRVADRAYVLRRGTVAFSGTAADMRNRRHEIEDSYLQA